MYPKLERCHEWRGPRMGENRGYICVECGQKVESAADMPKADHCNERRIAHAEPNDTWKLQKKRIKPMGEQQLFDAMVAAYQGHNPDEMPEGYDWQREAMKAALSVAKVVIRDEVLEEAAQAFEKPIPPETDKHMAEIASVILSGVSESLRAMKGQKL